MEARRNFFQRAHKRLFSVTDHFSCLVPAFVDAGLAPFCFVSALGDGGADPAPGLAVIAPLLLETGALFVFLVPDGVAEFPDCAKATPVAIERMAVVINRVLIFIYGSFPG